MYGLDKELPNLEQYNHSITSPPTNDYNCIAWAAGEDDRWWWPDSAPAAFWPANVLNEVSIQAFSEAFKILGYTECDNGNYEENIEKVALYVDKNNSPTHMSRQLNNLEWTSKLGPQWDISHNDNKVLNGPCYGQAKVYYSRKK